MLKLRADCLCFKMKISISHHPLHHNQPVAARAFHAEAFSGVILNTPHNTINMAPWFENPYGITLTHHITLI